ncbi:MAG: ferric reductase-like transmembrane domain-containing protein [Chloroflexi bacterium]|nr:ferric reductase-like transmembrane domain-containing protein [Chloroflexota bacterium]
MTDQTFWYLARSAGLTAYVLLWLNVMLGLAVRSNYLAPLLARWRTFDLHQFTALLALGFVGLHVVALLGDHYIGFTVAQLVVPFRSTYRPFWTGIGVLATYLVVAITGSFYVRRWIGQRTWRLLHYTSFGAFWLVLLHGLGAGSDSGALWGALLYWVTGAIAVAMLIWRITTPGQARPAAARYPTAR